MSDCIFCKIIKKEIPAQIVYEDEEMIVFKDLYPSAPVHLLLIPRKHIESLQDAHIDDQALLGRMMLKVPEVAEQNGLSGGFKVQINTGEAGGQEIFHLHIHIMGRPV